MTEEKKEEIELIPAEDNPWYQFYLQSIVLDRGDEGEGVYGIKPHGWHWFWGIYFLHQEMSKFRRFNLTAIQKRLPDEHWLKNATDDGEKITYQSDGSIPDHICQGEAVVALREILQKHKLTEAPEEINFSNLDFSHHLYLSKFIFPIQVCFHGSNFHKSVNFTQCRFFEQVNFNKTMFINYDSFPTRFEGAEFYDGVSFTGAKFTKSLEFKEVKFFKGACFSNATFHKVNFDNAEFINSAAEFEKTKFFGITSFVKTKFYKGAFFNDAEFRESPFYVNFSGANFTNAGHFNDANFYGLVIFSDAKFDSMAVFDGAKFSAESSFRGTNFLNHINFKNAIFEINIPVFYGAKITGDITWRNATWPSMNIKTDPDLIDQNQNAYENLTYHMKSLEKYHDTHFFFRQEMRCRRKLGSVFNSLLYGFYECFADYGYGVERALIAWFLHIVLGMIVIMSTISYGEIGLQESLFCSASVSVANANPYLFLVINDGGLMDCYQGLNIISPMVFGAVRGFQTIAGIPILFLVLLTLRVRFRLK